MPEGYSQQQTQDQNSGFAIPKLCWATKTDVLGQGTAASTVKVLLASTCAQPRAARPRHCSSCLAQESQSWKQMKHQVLLQQPGKAVPPTVTAALGCGDRADGSHEGSPSSSPLHISSVPLFIRRGPWQASPRLARPHARDSLDIGRCLPCAEMDGAERCSQDTHGQPCLDGFKPLHHDLTWEGAGSHQWAGQPSRWPARAVRSCNAGCTFCPFPRMLQTDATDTSPLPPWQDSGMLPKSGSGLIPCQDEPRCAPPT